MLLASGLLFLGVAVMHHNCPESVPILARG